MPTVVLISDMYGRFGDHGYMHDWAAWWLRRGFAVEAIFVDELVPNCHDGGSVPGTAREALHAQLTAAETVARAQQALLGRLRGQSAQVVVGFSYGGFLAGSVRAQLEPGVEVICISATRLRHILPLPVSEGVCAVFGARDPFKPSGQQLLASGLVTVEVPDAGHEVYRDPGACVASMAASVSAPWLMPAEDRAPSS
ncbi:dienelactone hydrolase family protein [Ralstonia solanacearum]|uniref:hypothetical protein n=1 Tax=Ralstonia solanacearum TaxID=305 RepID=UPI001CC29658|nr:hypothetical protein [Ralstonia solanacearum]